MGRERTPYGERLPRDPTPSDALRCLRLLYNRARRPVLTASEVADELCVDEARARELLAEAPGLHSREIEGTTVWWPV